MVSRWPESSSNQAHDQGQLLWPVEGREKRRCTHHVQPTEGGYLTRMRRVLELAAAGEVAACRNTAMPLSISPTMRTLRYSASGY